MADFRILQAADSALVIEFGSAIDRKISDRVLALAETVKAAELARRDRGRGDLPLAERQL